MRDKNAAHATFDHAFLASIGKRQSANMTLWSHINIAIKSIKLSKKLMVIQGRETHAILRTEEKKISHLNKTHAADGTTRFQCEHCLQRFLRRPAYLSHKVRLKT